jgi:hypothetical protein
MDFGASGIPESCSLESIGTAGGARKIPRI